MTVVIPILRVVELLGLEQRPGTKEMWVCPGCGHGALKTHEAKNAFFCFFCDKGGGSVRLAAIGWETDLSTAFERVCEELGLDPDEAPKPDLLIEELDKLEQGPPSNRDLLKHTLHIYWYHSAEENRAAAQLVGFYVPIEDWYAVIEDGIDAGVLSSTSLVMRAAKLALTSIRRIWASLGHAVALPMTSVHYTSAQAEGMRKRHRSFKDFCGRVVRKKPSVTWKELAGLAVKWLEIKTREPGIPKPDQAELLDMVVTICLIAQPEPAQTQQGFDFK